MGSFSVGTADLRVGDRFGPYQLDERLGEGGAGIVFRAVDTQRSRTVALKVLKRELDGETHRRRFMHEARAAREVEHKHLVPIIDAGEIDGRPFLAVQYVDGRSLQAWIEAEGALPIETVLGLATDVGSALDALHDRGLVHRDVKSSNILIARSGEALLSDFGLAKGPSYTSLTKKGQVVGTIDYLAPEVLRGERASAASDIYAFGCVMYESITGSVPFAGRHMFELGVAHLEEMPPDPAVRRSDLSSGLCWALLSALAKDPAERPTSGLAYATMLRIGAARAPA